MTLGEKIQKLRKERGLSQEALAEKVTVTRQTISKWELDQSTPDLDFVAQLSNIFHVSSDYLIKNEMTEPDKLPFKKKEYHLSAKAKRTILAIESMAALVAAYVCLICDYFTSKTLSWSFIAIVSIIAAWLLALPALTAKIKIIRKTLLAASIIPVPLLAILALLLKERIVLTMGTCISLVGVAALWMIYGIFCKYKKRLWRGFGFALLVFIPAGIIITHISACFMLQYSFDFTSDLFNSVITLMLSLVCFGLDYLFSRKTE